MSKYPKLSKFSTEKSAKTVNDAILEALTELGVTKDDVNVEILDEGKSGFFGIGRKDATVRVTVKESVIKAEDEAAKRTEIKGEKRNPKPKAKKTEKKAEEKKPVKPVKQKKLPPERISPTKEKKEEKKPEAKQPAEMTPEKKAEVAKVFATPEVRHPKRSERKERPERRPRPERAPKPETSAEPRERKPKKISGIPPQEIAVKFLSEIFAAMQLNVVISASMESDDTVLVNLEGENMGLIIGKRGDTLDGLQYLTSLVINQQTEGYTKVTIDTENYREKRNEALIALSNRLAEKVAKSGKKFTLEPMNPYERRIIHSNLQNHEAVTTFSIGTEPYRKVVIAPKDRKPMGKRGARKRPNRSKQRAKAETPQTAEKKSTITYKADFKPQQHKAEFKSFEDYFNAHEED